MKNAWDIDPKRVVREAISLAICFCFFLGVVILMFVL